MISLFLDFFIYDWRDIHSHIRAEYGIIMMRKGQWGCAESPRAVVGRVTGLYCFTSNMLYKKASKPTFYNAPSVASNTCTECPKSQRSHQWCSTSTCQICWVALDMSWSTPPPHCRPFEGLSACPRESAWQGHTVASSNIASACKYWESDGHLLSYEFQHTVSKLETAERLWLPCIPQILSIVHFQISLRRHCRLS